MSSSTSACPLRRLVREEAAQASVEAALLLPILMFSLGFLLQPACLLYTRAVMGAAASEAARALATAPAGDTGPYEEMLRRRLEAVPAVSIFRTETRDSWQIELEGAGSDTVRVAVSGHVRPVPLLGVLAQVFGQMDGEEVLIHVEVEERVRPEWLDGSYKDWIGIWG